MNFDVIYDDEALLVVTKPAGLPTLMDNDGGIETLQAQLCEKYPAQTVIPDGGIAHRLDNDTSGIVCAAKTIDAYHDLRNQFVQHSARKEYVALVLGHPPKEGTVDAPIAHHPRKKKKMVVCESDQRTRKLKGRGAHTAYRVTRRYRNYSLLEVAITTGVRHQIRAHLAWIGYPLAGDRLYQNAAKRAEDTLPLNRHFLHASRLTIKHPITGKMMSFESNLPAELQSILKHL